GTSAGGQQTDKQIVSGTDVTTGANTVDTGTFFVSETVTNASDFDSTLACVNNADAQNPVAVSTGANDSVAVGKGDVIVCTYTNTRKQGSIRSKKHTPELQSRVPFKSRPLADRNQTDQQILSGTNGTTGAYTVNTGTSSVSYTLSLHDALPISLACVNNADAQNPVAVSTGANDSVAVGKGDVIVCTYTNTRKQGSI